MKRRGNQVQSKLNKVIRSLALKIDQQLVLATPVDTGRARSNWLVSLDQPRTTEIAPYSEGKGLGKSEGANANAAIQQGLGEIGKRKPQQTIYIRNNVPYIGKLNEGSSKQAPANFVRKSVLNAIEVLRRIKLIE